MNKYLVCVLSLFVVAAARADHKADHKGPLSMGGSFEGGLATSFGGATTKGSEWLVDNVEMKNGYTVSDKTKVTVIHGFTANNGVATGQTSRGADSRGFFNPMAMIGGAVGLLYGVREAYVTHQCAEKFNTSVGMFRNVFGFENQWDRYDMATYYYSRAYGVWQGNGWNYNLGVKFNIHGLDATVFQSVNGGGDTRSTPGVALRYKFDVSGGDWTLTPVLSAYFGKFFGAPKDMAFSGGATWKMGALWTNASFEWGQAKPTAGGTGPKDWSIVVEPGFDLGVANFSAKWEFTENTTAAGAKTNDMNLGVALTKSYDKMRTRILYAHNNLGGKFTGHANEIRLLFGAEW